ncbi:MAG: acetyl/propionyl/methylcrotonyl-CoA carboxylase subunit alpha [Sphingomonadales bacterium]|nr:acetyl/propionyl/methylcrotonyl-CoA carboxylase subunit alpha [Sphingomonadales bacterium]
MFKKILIANRGEIACRIIASAKKMGVASVAVYSEADADARHVKMADEAVFIGPPAAAESYLVGEKIIAAALKTGAEAIHPGYGFLSENAGFLKEVEKAGLIFIGPGVEAITSMGDKIASKKLAAKAGVTTVPGYVGVIKDAKEAVKISKEIGFPVMIKASAGGGGKGMRIAESEMEVEEGFNASKSEAKSSFGDDRIFIEKYITQPRHIEIQVLGDKHGNVIYLAERECSIQRRHQKVVEEAPSSFLDDATRKAMGEQAVALAQAVGYHSAGTVEFIVDNDKNFYFLEMNTRLQVEHPVTELITGVDLVEEMLKVAYGDKLSIKQSQVKIKGWAFETRVYAEDPFRGFLPSIGRLTRYVTPPENKNVRVDTGVYEGAEISMFYDPMIAKLITYGASRDEAIAEMRKALDAYYIRGISHNIPFLSAVMAHPRMRSGDISTSFIAEEYPDGFEGGHWSDDVKTAMLACSTYVNAMIEIRNNNAYGKADGHGFDADGHWTVRVDGERTPVHINMQDGGGEIKIGKKSITIRSQWMPGQPVFDGFIDGVHRFIEVDKLASGFCLTSDGVSKNFIVLRPEIAELYKYIKPKVKADTSNLLLCPMPGLVVSVAVSVGDEVKAGQALAIVEAMKMENILRAEKDATIKAVLAKTGDSLAVDDVIIEFES